MPVTTLDPVTALIVIDLQKGIAGYPILLPLPTHLARIRTLLHAFRGAGLPVVLVNVEARPPGRTEQGPRSSLAFADGWTDLLPELEQHPDDIVITKRSWGAFVNTTLESLLKARGVTQVVVTGLVTSGGVEATARQAYELGFHVTLALDAMSDVREDAQNYTVQNVFPRLGETGSAQEIVAMLQKRSA